MKSIGFFVAGFLLGAAVLWWLNPAKSDLSSNETTTVISKETIAEMDIRRACSSVDAPRKWSKPSFKSYLESAARLDPDRYLVYLEDYNYLTLKYPDSPISNPEDENAYLAVSRLDALCDLNAGD
jgi:hypothetical protein